MTMQELHSPELVVGEVVLIDWPRTRWDHRSGRLHALRHEPGERLFGYVLLDGIAMRIPLERIIKKARIRSIGMTEFEK